MRIAVQIVDVVMQVLSIVAEFWSHANGFVWKAMAWTDVSSHFSMNKKEIEFIN